MPISKLEMLLLGMFLVSIITIIIYGIYVAFQIHLLFGIICFLYFIPLVVFLLKTVFE